jgi:hypothetical protein
LALVEMATRLAEIAAPKFLTWARPVIAPTGPRH